MFRENKCYLNRSTPRVLDDLIEAAARHGDAALTDDQNDLLDKICGVAPGFAEAFSTAAARDAALGPYGPYVEFVPTTVAEVEAAGFETADIAIGHRVDEPGFDRLAPMILDAVAAKMAETGQSGSVVIARVRYDVYARANGQVGISAAPEYEVEVDQQQMEATMRWMQLEVRRRLAVHAIS